VSSRIMKTVFLWIFTSSLLSGCWDIKDAQDMNYFTAIGFDYADNEYRVYAQMLDLSSVTKSETGKPSQVTPLWVGRGRGETVSAALNDLYETAQLRVFYGHINAVIYSERVMKKGMDYIFDLQNRFSETRYTPWMFGTQLSIIDLLSTNAFFNLSPAASLLYQPKESYKQKSIILPLTTREFIADYREPGSTARLPSIGINSTDWKKDRKPHPLLDIDGLFTFYGGKYVGRLSEDQLLGLRWTQSETNRSPILIRSNGKLHVALSLETPKVKIIPTIKDDEVTYTLDIKLRGNIIEIIHPLPESTLEQYASEQVRDEIRQTFETGLNINADLFQLEHVLYRHNNKQWKKLKQQNQLKLTANSLKINVTVQIVSSGKLKVAP
jgi:spore germination protein KC